MTSQLPVQCLACARLLAGSTCEAYPAGIPSEIAMRGADHRTARGDEVDGLHFEQADNDKARRAFEWWQRVFGPAA